MTHAAGTPVPPEVLSHDGRGSLVWTVAVEVVSVDGWTHVWPLEAQERPGVWDCEGELGNTRGRVVWHYVPRGER